MARLSARRPAPRSYPSRPRILVIDDDDAVCSAVAETLRDSYAVATAPHGAAALDLLGSHEPALILLDLRMPIMDGWSFVEHYRRSNPAPAPIVLMSAARDLHQLAKQLGLADVLAKPFQMSDLIAMVAAHIRPVAFADAASADGRATSGGGVTGSLSAD